jgi:hypothetical protein
VGESGHNRCGAAELCVVPGTDVRARIAP